MKQNERRSALEMNVDNIFSSFLRATKSEMNQQVLAVITKLRRYALLQFKKQTCDMISRTPDSTLLSK